MSPTKFRWAAAWRQLFKQINLYKKDTVQLVGKDGCGNKYYEAYKPNNPRNHIQRYFLRDDITADTFAVDIAKVPPAWEAWLRFKRQDPPSEEELRESEEYFKSQQAMAAQRRQAAEMRQQQEDEEENGSLNSAKAQLERSPPSSRVVGGQQKSKLPQKRAFPKLPHEV